MPAKLTFAIIISILSALPSHSWAASHVFGRIEYVTLGTFPDRLKAKLDTGAKTSSISAINIEQFEKNGKPWVRFDVVHPKKNLALSFSRPLLRTAKIKNRSGESLDQESSSQRPVVSMTICLRNTLENIEVNLVDRRHFLYPMLLGTEAIAQFEGLVDPSRVFTIRPTCLKSS